MKQPAPILPPSEPEPPLSIPEKNPVAPPPAPAPTPVPAPEKGPERIQPPVDNTPLPPIDIPGFVQISQGVAAGQQPFPDGATWLQQQGYRSVVHLRAPGSDDQAARRQFESKGLRFYSIEVSPQTVNRQTLEQLTRILDDEKNHPVYFYDRDGYLVGGMWYLKLRIHDMLDSAQALDKAQRLGLNPELNANHRAMWNAVRQLGER